jgi:ATP-dependent RNA helicase DOB1
MNQVPTGRKRNRQDAGLVKDTDDGNHDISIDTTNTSTTTLLKKGKNNQQNDVGAAIVEASSLNIDTNVKESIVNYTASSQDTNIPNNSSANSVTRSGEIDESRSTAPSTNDSTLVTAMGQPPAKVYPFTLDPFQKRAIECLERDESVLVSAHTSAGKTVVAEYAIAMALRDKQRVIYTSPIKALSNQKYRDLFEEFSDVGLLTGDVTINPSASCLVMTTEILRSMLYRGSEVMREVKWVIYDEIHYMRDKERGVVWEESIIMLPHKVRFVFLSATIPNSREFAEWIAKIHSQTCHVVYTDYRPTPLQHFIYPSAGDGVFLVVDERGRFREDNFTKAMAALGSSALGDAIDGVVNKGEGSKSMAKSLGKKKTTSGAGSQSDLYRIIKMIMERSYDPVIVFSFSKRECEQYALQIAKLDITTSEEKKLIEQVFTNAIDSLAEEDRKLPQISAILPLLKRGIGIHHGGLLPILKELVEILFQESLLKVLFATETFSMGINMPARTVVFTASRKFDGVNFRWISAGEYIQMSGRAGRRGLDDRGIVIQMMDEKMEPDVAKDILKGTADPLNSAFHLGYNMLLNLLRMEGVDPERMMQLSFHQFQSERAIPPMQEELAKIEKERDDVYVEGEVEVAEYFDLKLAHAAANIAVRNASFTRDTLQPFLQAGRLIRIAVPNSTTITATSGNLISEEWGWGIVISAIEKTHLPEGTIGSMVEKNSSSNHTFFVTEVLLPVRVQLASSNTSSKKNMDTNEEKVNEVLSPAIETDSVKTMNGKIEMRILPVAFSALAAISSVRVFLPKDLRTTEALESMRERLAEVQRRFPVSAGGLPLLDPEKDLRVDSPTLHSALERERALLSQLVISSLHNAPVDSDAYKRLDAYSKKLDCEARASFLRTKIRACQNLVMSDTLKNMKRVLRRLGHINAENVVQIKGRVACEINTADELLVTELIFNGAFNDLDVAQTVCFCFNTCIA